MITRGVPNTISHFQLSYDHAYDQGLPGLVCSSTLITCHGQLSIWPGLSQVSEIIVAVGIFSCSIITSSSDTVCVPKCDLH